MSSIEYACVFVRAAGDRLLTAERFVCGLRHLFGGELVSCDLAYRLTSRFLVAVLRFSEDGAGIRDRLAFWAARAGGRANPLGSMPEKDRRAFDAQVELCELRVRGATRATLFEQAGRLFTEAGAPPQRRRNAVDRPILALDVGGAGFEGVTFDAERVALFVAAPIAPPVGDTIPLVFRLPGVGRPVAARAEVLDVRPPADAGPGRPAGFALGLVEAAADLTAALSRHAPSAAGEVRAAPRFQVKAPVKVIPASGQARAVIEYATDQELQADFIENLSQGGAFVRSANPAPVGTELDLEFRLPNGSELRSRATVAFANAQGMGVRFTLDEEGEASLQAAIAHISARARRALVVDDDALQRRVLADALADRGFEVLTGGDGADGLRVLSEELLALDLLLTDVFMPGMDGETFVRTIRQAGGEADLAIVVVTSRKVPGLERRLDVAGADAVLDKALGAELVAQAADAVLERKRVGREA
jgi:CheY-like chemotaxis protein